MSHIFDNTLLIYSQLIGKIGMATILILISYSISASHPSFMRSNRITTFYFIIIIIITIILNAYYLVCMWRRIYSFNSKLYTRRIQAIKLSCVFGVCVWCVFVCMYMHTYTIFVDALFYFSYIQYFMIRCATQQQRLLLKKKKTTKKKPLLSLLLLLLL
jgi:hypothetical protein